MNHRLQVVLSDPADEQLRKLAAFVGRPPSTLAAELIRDGLQRAAGGERTLPAAGGFCDEESLGRGPSAPGDEAGGRAAWLEPYGGDPEWRSEMWSQIVALHGRYPRHLAHLKDGWWTDESHTETLCALARWRQQLDDQGTDPREELVFQIQLADYAQVLRGEGGGITKAWQPGPPPPQWASG